MSATNIMPFKQLESEKYRYFRPPSPMERLNDHKHHRITHSFMREGESLEEERTNMHRKQYLHMLNIILIGEHGKIRCVKIYTSEPDMHYKRMNHGITKKNIIKVTTLRKQKNTAASILVSLSGKK